jgi:hypothetical protein
VKCLIEETFSADRQTRADGCGVPSAGLVPPPAAPPHLVAPHEVHDGEEVHDRADVAHQDPDRVDHAQALDAGPLDDAVLLGEARDGEAVVDELGRLVDAPGGMIER